jgi:hypothetical protein
MADDVRTRYPAARIAAAAIAAAAIALAVLLALSARYPLPVLIGVRPLPLFVGVALLVALAVAALFTDPSSRHPSFAMSKAEKYRLLAWWLGMFAALLLLAYGCWKGWGVVATFAAVGAAVKVLQVATLIRGGRSIRIWHPFAVIAGLFLFVLAVVQFLTRTNLPPPVEVAMTAYHAEHTLLAPASRPAPDVSSTGLRLQESGDVDLGGLPATLYSYDDSEGSRVDVYEADFGFPAPQGSEGMDAPPGWLFESYRLSLRTGPEGSDFMVVSWSTDIADRIARVIADQSSG